MEGWRLRPSRPAPAAYRMRLSAPSWSPVRPRWRSPDKSPSSARRTWPRQRGRGTQPGCKQATQALGLAQELRQRSEPSARGVAVGMDGQNGSFRSGAVCRSRAPATWLRTSGGDLHSWRSGGLITKVSRSTPPHRSSVAGAPLCRQTATTAGLFSTYTH